MNVEPKVDARREQRQRFVINDERLKMNDDEDCERRRKPPPYRGLRRSIGLSSIFSGEHPVM